ncbi:HIT family protein [Pseudoduganella violacea]|uniref:Diadenosine tetraphosphate (Ap4A) HIT family hydrolase n=1 Tax=Pseudoduganella violacea TaxID=1715466 RepID=A0A7W5FUY4_9BURK|nr:HIT family protein [Pseudoduganella violacea]MBB3120259.1 diadenosine tetraphosphate (Ap4A) HIT family hydrolase [Pseudoduganella violacea]
MSVNKPCDLCTLLAAFAGGDDASLIWRDERLSVVLVDEPGYPGYCRVVWNAHVKEMTDLAPEDREHVMRAVWQVELAQREVMAPHKVNVASFGNMTPHVHWHVIPRYTDDAHFPNPTWGAQQREAPVQAVVERSAMLPALRAAIIQRLSA